MGKEASFQGLLGVSHLLKVESFNTTNNTCWYEIVSLEIILLLCRDVSNKNIKRAIDYALGLRVYDLLVWPSPFPHINLQFLEIYKHHWKLQYRKKRLSSLVQTSWPVVFSEQPGIPSSVSRKLPCDLTENNRGKQGKSLRNPFNNVTSKATKMWLLTRPHLGVYYACPESALSRGYRGCLCRGDQPRLVDGWYPIYYLP